MLFEGLVRALPYICLCLALSLFICEVSEECLAVSELN